jgi:hypothetical protein
MRIRRYCLRRHQAPEEYESDVDLHDPEGMAAAYLVAAAILQL